ncbi:MAG: glycogen debranching enzyme GlgX, partial [Parafilimonas terrae]|nr:glycogen debranching enzyme GlgX [Parafilimonas terrae]
DVAARVTGSADKFDKRGRKPWASVNFLTAHDGFTLHDTVAYNDKHNEANGEGNRDGHSHNLSYNYGVEGPTDDPGIRAVRLRQMRNMLATLFLSRGTPMLLAGDEFARSQKGNNNAYCQDNEISWLDWGAIAEEERDLAEFTQRLIILRNALPILSRGRFLTGRYDEEFGIQDVTWLRPDGSEMAPENWSDGEARAFAVRLDGRAQPTGVHRKGGDATLLLLFNAYHDLVTFNLPETVGGEAWTRLLDTNLPDSQDVESFGFGQPYEVTGRSLLMFVLKPEDTPGDAATEMERSYQHVMQAFERANVERVRFHLDEEG